VGGWRCGGHWRGNRGEWDSPPDSVGGKKGFMCSSQGSVPLKKLSGKELGGVCRRRRYAGVSRWRCVHTVLPMRSERIKSRCQCGSPPGGGFLLLGPRLLGLTGCLLKGSTVAAIK